MSSCYLFEKENKVHKKKTCMGDRQTSIESPVITYQQCNFEKIPLLSYKVGLTGLSVHIKELRS